jgi:hypothetical protein
MAARITRAGSPNFQDEISPAKLAYRGCHNHADIHVGITARDARNEPGAGELSGLQSSSHRGR